MWKAHLEMASYVIPILAKSTFFFYIFRRTTPRSNFEFQDHLVLLRDDLQHFLSTRILDETAFYEYIIYITGIGCNTYN